MSARGHSITFLTRNHFGNYIDIIPNSFTVKTLKQGLSKDEASNLGIKIYTIGVGTIQGAPIPIKRNGILQFYKRDENNEQVTGGQRLFSLKFLADYDLSRNLTASFYYDQNSSEYAVSTSYPRNSFGDWSDCEKAKNETSSRAPVKKDLYIFGN